MKKLLTFSAIAILGVALITGCAKKTTSSPGYNMAATINGVAFKGSNCIATLSSGVLSISGGSFTSTPTYPYIFIEVPGYTGAAGTYAFGGSTLTSADVDSSTTTSAVSISGSVVITSTTPNLAGTFSFTCTDGTQVINGTFFAKAP